MSSYHKVTEAIKEKVPLKGLLDDIATNFYRDQFLDITVNMLRFIDAEVEKAVANAILSGRFESKVLYDCSNFSIKIEAK